jgi:hypothetical protein
MNYYFTKSIMYSEISARSAYFNEMDERSEIMIAQYFFNESGKKYFPIKSEFINPFMDAKYLEQFKHLQSVLAESIIDNDKEVLTEMWQDQVSKYLMKKAS